MLARSAHSSNGLARKPAVRGTWATIRTATSRVRAKRVCVRSGSMRRTAVIQATFRLPRARFVPSRTSSHASRIGDGVAHARVAFRARDGITGNGTTGAAARSGRLPRQADRPRSPLYVLVVPTKSDLRYRFRRPQLRRTAGRLFAASSDG